MRKPLAIVIVLVFAAAVAAAWWYLDYRETGQEEQQATALETGIEHFNAKNYAAAIEQLGPIPAEFAQAGRARYFHGSALIMLKDYSGALPALEEGLLLDPDNTRIMHALGVAHFKLGNLALSKAYFARVLEIDPTDEEARGLMDIMANLERMQQRQPAAAPDDEGP